MTDGFDQKVIELLKNGGVGLLPSDTIYGLSCRALDKKAVERVRILKGRDAGKPFIILISDIKMLDLLSISENQAEAVKQYWPGAVSAILQAANSSDWLQRGTQSLAVRLPDYLELRNLIRQVGPIVSTSANLQGQPPVSSAREAQKIFGDKLDFYVDVGELNKPPSTLAIIEDDKLKVVRQGAVKINGEDNHDLG